VKRSSRSIPYGAIARWVVLAFGILGAILPALVDMFPNASWTSILHLRKLDAGFASLSSFDDTIHFSDTGNEKTGGLLHQREEGYDAIYSLLRTRDSQLPTLQEIKASTSTPDQGAIFVYEVERFRNVGGSIPTFRPVQLSLRESGVVPLCELGDLADLIRERKLRFWSRLGSALALLGLLIPLMPTSKSITASPTPNESVSQIELIDGEPRQESTREDSRKSKSEATAGFLLAVGIVLGIILTAKRKEQKSSSPSKHGG